MKHHLMALGVAAGGWLWLAVPQVAVAGPIERACLDTGRAEGALCGCIQQIADATLTRRDQRKAARFFADPDRAQEVRMSRRADDNAFWERYRRFGDTAELSCARG